jgi:hypothetical protein
MDPFIHPGISKPRLSPVWGFLSCTVAPHKWKVLSNIFWILTNFAAMKVSLKAASLTKYPLLCELEDEGISFAGDMGAIGRITCCSVDKGGIKIDLKGRV